MKINFSFLEAVFVDRPNRFLTRVELNGEIVESHLPDPGRLQELLLPGVKILLKEENGANRKTRYSTQAVYSKGILISLNTLLPNKFVEFLIKNRKLEFLSEWDIFKRESQFEHSRFDFQLFKGEIKMFLEVKSVTLVENRIAKFPDAVTERGKRHVNHLGEMAARGLSTMVLFVIQRHDAERFQPQWERDPKFGLALHNAWLKGLKVNAIQMKMSKKKLSFIGSVPTELNPPS